MKIGLNLSGISPRHYPAVGEAAEAAGFESLWVPDHLVLPAQMPDTYPYAEGGQPPIVPGTAVYDPWVVLATVASRTTRIRLGTSVYVLPLRHPLVTARAVLTLDRISGGRAILGAGVGWLRTEFAAVGIDARARGSRMDETITLLRRLWSEDVVEHDGENFSLAASRFEPKPVSKPTIPIEIGGSSAPALRRAGTLGDGWIAIGADDLGAYRSMADEVLAHREDSGRGGPFEITATTAADRDAVATHLDLPTTRVVVPLGDLAVRSPGEPELVDRVRAIARELNVAG